MTRVLLLILATQLITSSYCYSSQLSQNIRDNANDTAGDAPNSESTAASGNTLELTSGKDKKNISFKLSPRFSNSNFSLLLSAPLDEQSDSTDINESNEMVDGAAIKLNYQRVHFDIGGDEFNNISPVKIKAVQDDCKAHPESYGFSKPDQCIVKIDTLIENYKGNLREVKEVVQLIKSFLERPILMYGATATYSEKEYSYFASNALDKETHRKYPWASSIYLSWGNPKKNYLVGIEFEYQERYKAADDEIRCPGTSGGGYFSCQEAASSAPEKTTGRVTSLIYRKKLEVLKTSLAVSPKISYNNQNSLFEVQLPVYLFQDANNNLTGGIRIDWDNDKHDTNLSVFVGNTFSTF